MQSTFESLRYAVDYSFCDALELFQHNMLSRLGQNVDKLFVLSHGQVAETGTHSELVEQKGLYAKLWSRQAGGKSKTE